MPSILRSTLIDDQVIAADGPVQVALPVNPLSIILLTIKAVNSTAVLANYSSIAQLLAMITNARVSYRGASIINGSLQDLAVLYGCLSRWMPAQMNRQEVTAMGREITVPLLFGRTPYDPKECFPATRRGDLLLDLTADIAVTGLTGLQLLVETVELLDATPERFIKATTTSKPIAATGNDALELPIGNDLLGLLLFAPQAGDWVATTPSWFKIATLIDNVETLYSSTSFESLHGELHRKLGAWPQQPHTHGFTYDPTLLVVTNAETREQEEHGQLLDHYAYMDFDPLNDGQYALKTAGAARVNLLVQFEGTPPETPRALPVELVTIPGGAAAG